MTSNRALELFITRKIVAIIWYKEYNQEDFLIINHRYDNYNNYNFLFC